MPAPERWQMRIQGQPAGGLVQEREADGSLHVRYQWSNNGRGPRMDERFAVDTTGRPLRYEVQGQAIFGNAIRESFTVGEGRLRWTSVVDQGDEAAEPGKLFVPLESTPAYLAQLARALLARADGQASAPGGTLLKIERLRASQVELAPGRTLPVALHAITGGEVNPWYLWLRDDGSQRLFGLVEPGWHLLPEDLGEPGEASDVGKPGAGGGARLEAIAASLFEQQQQAQAARLKAIGERSSQRLAGLTRIAGVRWFDAPAARMRGPADIYLLGGRISAITAPGAWTLAVAQQIDGRGRTLLPGLLDAHTHIDASDGPLHLAGGVTTVRDMANDNEALWRLMERLEAGEVPGPRVVPAGLIEGQSPHALRNGIVAADLAQALAAVDFYAARGYHQLKLYNSIRPEWVQPIARRAHAQGLTVAGHVPAFMRAEEAVRAGYDELTHINQLMLNFFVRRSDDTRTLVRFTLPAEKTRAIKDADVRRFVALLARKGTVVDATLAAFEAMFTQRNGETNRSLADIAPHLPVLWRRSLLNSEMGPDEAQALRWRESWARMLRFMGELHRAGVTLVAGTDSVPGLALHRELMLYAQCGIPAPEVLRMATWTNARVAGIADRAGRIAPGRPADLVLIEGDPSRDLAELRRASLVIQGERAYAPAALYESMGIRPFVPAARIDTPPTSARSTP